MTHPNDNPSTYQLCSFPRPRAEAEASLAAFDAATVTMRLADWVALVKDRRIVETVTAAASATLSTPRGAHTNREAIGPRVAAELDGADPGDVATWDEVLP